MKQQDQVRVEYLFGFYHLLYVLQLLLELPFLFAWKSRPSSKERKGQTPSLIKDISKDGEGEENQTYLCLTKLKAQMVLRPPTWRRSVQWWVGGKREGPVHRSNKAAAPRTGSQIFSLQESVQHKAIVISNFQKKKNERGWWFCTCLDTHQIEWECLRALVAQSHL